MHYKKIQKQKFLEQIKNRNIKDKSKFIGVNLSKMKFRDIDFSNIDFSKGNFKESEFVKCVFKNILLRAANLEHASFIDCVFEDADFEFSDIKYGRFENCIMNKVDLRDCKLEESFLNNNKITDALFEGAAFNYSKIKKSEFKKIKSRKAVFEGIEIRESVFRDADFTASDFKGALLKTSIFEDILFISVIAYGLEISNSTFKGANFFNADFKEVRLPKELRSEIIRQGGIVSPEYCKLIWRNKYARACLMLIFLFIIFMIMEGIMNPVFWSADKLLNRANKAANKSRDFKNAKKFLEIGLSRKNLSEDEKIRIKLTLADILQNKGDKEEALKIYMELKGTGGAGWCRWDAMSRIAQVYRNEGKTEEAIREYKEAIGEIGEKDIERRAWISLELGDVYRDAGNKEEARKMYGYVIKDGSISIERNIEGRFRAIDLFRRDGKNEEALNMTEEGLMVVKDTTQRCWLLFNKAEILQNKGDKEEALKIYMELKGTGGAGWCRWDAMSRIAQVYRNEGNTEEAIKEYKELIWNIGEKDIERRAWISLELGDVYREIGNKKEEKKLYQGIKMRLLNSQDLINEINKRLEGLSL